MTVRSSLSILAVASAGVLAAGAARADWCVDLRTSQTYDCAKEPPAASGPAPSHSPATSALRDQLRRNLANAANSPPPPDRLAIARRVEDASQRVDSALRSAELTSDPTEKAQAKRAYESAMSDLRSSTRQFIDTAPDAAQKERLTQALKDSEARHASMAADAGLVGGASAAPAPAVAAAPKPDTFSVCEAPERGVTTCYEIGKTGSACQKVFWQGGQLSWRDPQMSTCSAGDLAQRDAFFAGKPVGTDPLTPPEIDPRSQQLAGVMSGVSAQCQADLKNYLYGSRDSKSAGSDQTMNTMRSFAGINKDPQCKAALDRLASTAGVEMPQRRLASKARGAWDSAMADRPRAEVNVPTGEYMAKGYYSDGSAGGDGWNTGEVIDAGIQILGVLSNVLGAFAGVSSGGYSSGPTYTSRPAGATRTYGQGSPTGSGYVYRNGGSGSTITGTR